ncbi:MAG: peptidoglycan-binding domain-containing protein [Eubacteriales bacterium]|nr:peptidoglycan-binding domain-containing protein [Eubacteriales bacterium]
MDLLNVLTVYMALVYTSALQTAPEALRFTPTPTLEPIAVLESTMTPTPSPSPTPQFSPEPSAVPKPEMTANPDYKQLNPKDKGEEVSRLQAQLYKYGYYTGAIDGSYGPQTYTAVQLFQRLHSLSADGIAGRQTLTLLYEGQNILILTDNLTTEAPEEETTEEVIAPIALPSPIPTLVAPQNP